MQLTDGTVCILAEGIYAVVEERATADMRAPGESAVLLVRRRRRIRIVKTWDNSGRRGGTGLPRQEWAFLWELASKARPTRCGPKLVTRVVEWMFPCRGPSDKRPLRSNARGEQSPQWQPKIPHSAKSSTPRGFRSSGVL